MSLSDTISSFFENLPAAVRAAFWLLLASTSFLLMMSLARHLADDIDMRVIVFWRAVFGVVFMLPWLAQRGLHVMKTEKIVSHFTRTLLAYGGMLCLFYAATMISLADVTAIAFLRPIVGSALAIVVLGEAALGRRWVATLVGLIGALIIVRPGLIEINTGVWIVLGAVLINSFYAILGKYLVRTDSPDTVAMYMMLILTPISFVAALFVWQWPSGEQFLWLILFGALGTLSQRTLARAYHAADATVVMSFDFLRLPIAVVIGFVLFAEFPDIWVWIGGAVICASSVFIAHRESVAGMARSA